MVKRVNAAQFGDDAEWRDLTSIDAFLRVFGYGLAVSLSGKHEIMIHRLDPPATVATYAWEQFANGGETGRRQFARDVLRMVGGPDVDG